MESGERDSMRKTQEAQLLRDSPCRQQLQSANGLLEGVAEDTPRTPTDSALCALLSEGLLCRHTVCSSARVPGSTRST